MDVVGQARDGEDGLRQARSLTPDVITLDIEMPKMDGLTMLGKLMYRQPVPVVMLSTLTQAGAAATLEALDLGAVDFVAKPGSGRAAELVEARVALVRAVRQASVARVQQRAVATPRTVRTLKSPPAVADTTAVPTRVTNLVVIGSSTGGPPALGEVVPQLPTTLNVPIVIVQHMPPTFTASLAERLDGLSALTVREATDGEPLRNNWVYVAPGGKQLSLGIGSRLRVSCEAPAVNGVRPSVDYFLDSIGAELAGRSVVAILTGMGKDGAYGSEQIHKYGGRIIAQDEQSCTVYGMPRAVADLGIVDKVAPLRGIAAAIGHQLSNVRKHGRRAMPARQRSTA